MLADLFQHLEPTRNHREYDQFRRDCSHLLTQEPTLFWYLSSAMHFRPLALLSDKDANRMGIPPIEFIVYSDYDHHFVQRSWFNAVTNTRMSCHKVAMRTEVYLNYMIPLRFNTPEFLRRFPEIREIDKRFDSPDEGKSTMHRNFPFLVGEIEMRSEDFGMQRKPILYAAMDNWLLLEFFKSCSIRCDYICNICDSHDYWKPSCNTKANAIRRTEINGICDGGGYRCATEHFHDFQPVMKENSYWISDHLKMTEADFSGPFEPIEALSMGDRKQFSEKHHYGILYRIAAKNMASP